MHWMAYAVGAVTVQGNDNQAVGRNVMECLHVGGTAD